MDRTWRIHTIVLFVILEMSILPALLSPSRDVSALTSHEPIHITGNQDFIAAEGVIGGSGTPLDPYIIAGWDIDASSVAGIRIKDTDVHFIIRDVHVHSGGWDYDGVYLVNVTNGRVENVTSEGNRNGFHLEGSHWNIVTGNTVFSNSLNGTYLEHSTNNTIADNRVFSNRFNGIELYFSQWNNVTGNIVWNSRNGMGIYYSANNTIADNRVFSNRMNGIEFLSSNNSTIAYNSVFSNIAEGITLVRSNNGIIENNKAFSHNTRGIFVDYSSGNAIMNNTASFNMMGIRLGRSARNAMVNNTVVANTAGIGILLEGDSNVAYHNSLLDNGAESWGRLNLWDEGYPGGGNYWEAYNGTDEFTGPLQDVPGSDGIGDFAYSFRQNGTDRFPLMHPHVPVDTTPPDAPTSVEVRSGPTADSVTLLWSHPDKPDVHHYLVYVYDTAEATLLVGLEATASGDETQLTIPDLVQGKTYWFRIAAVDAAGNESPRVETVRRGIDTLLLFLWLVPILVVLFVALIAVFAWGMKKKPGPADIPEEKTSSQRNVSSSAPAPGRHEGDNDNRKPH